MKKKILFIFVMSMLTVGVSACGDQEQKPAENLTDTESVSEEVSENGKLETDESETLEFQQCSYGEKITTDFTEIILDKSMISSEICPDTSSSNYMTQMGEVEGQKILGVIGTIKNVSSNSYLVGNIYGEIVIDNQYSYSLSAAIEEGSSVMSLAELKPLQTAKYYLCAYIPDEQVENFSEFSIKFGFKENFEAAPTDYSLCDYCYQIEETSVEDIEREETEESGLEFETAELSSVIDTGYLEMSLDTFERTNEIAASNTESFYECLPEEENSDYMYLSGSFKLTGADPIDIRYIYVEFVFDDTYTYPGDVVASNGGKKFVNDINPLENVTYYLYASVPNELLDTYKSCTVYIGFTQNFAPTFRDTQGKYEFENCDDLYQVLINR